MKLKQITFLCLISLTVSAIGFAAYLNRPYADRLSAYVTDLQARTPVQRANILLAAAHMDGVILQPGETFSLNQLAGPYTEDRGYQPERSIQGKQMTNSPGGGVCQLASTLYNSAKGADLEIIERIPHTQKVSSVPLGYDATLAYAWADLKFRNPHAKAIQLKSRELNEQLLIEIWGQEARP